MKMIKRCNEEIKQIAAKRCNPPSLPEDDRYHDHVFGAAIDSHRMVVVFKGMSRGKPVLLYDDRYPSKWTPLPDAPGRRSCTAVTSYNGSLIVVDGVSCGNDDDKNEVHMLDIDKKKWTHLPSTNHKRDHCSIAALGNYIYAFGGFQYHYRPGMGLGYGLTRFPQNSVERFDTISMKWEDLPPMPTKRALSTAAVIGNTIIVAGGTKHDWGTGKDVVEVLDAEHLTWSVAPSLPIKNFASAAASAGSRMIVTGGIERLQNNESLGVTQIYDSASQVWKILPATMSTGRAWHACALLGSGKLIVAGGAKVSGVTHKCCRRHVFNCVETITIPMTWDTIGPFVMMRWLVQQERAVFVDEYYAGNSKSTFSSLARKIQANSVDHISSHDFHVTMKYLVSHQLPDDLFQKICSYLR